MNKKIIIIVACIFAVVLGIYGFKLVSQRSPVSHTSRPDSSSTSNKFSTEDKISSTDTVVKITGTGFVPDNITIKKGTKVVWLNQTNDFVWPASNPHPIHTDYPGFDPQEPFKKGETWQFTFDRVGNWGYHDHLHPSMKATVSVTD